MFGRTRNETGKKKRSKLADVAIMGELFPRADAIAHADGRREAGAEHLVLAACELPDGSANRALTAVGATREALERAIGEVHAGALASAGVSVDEPLVDQLDVAAQTGPLRSSGAAKVLFKQVVDLVRAERSQLHGAWFVLVAAETERGTLRRAFDLLGVDRVALAAAARDEVVRSDTDS